MKVLVACARMAVLCVSLASLSLAYPPERGSGIERPGTGGRQIRSLAYYRFSNIDDQRNVNDHDPNSPGGGCAHALEHLWSSPALGQD
jgi:hypothetical protein